MKFIKFLLLTLLLSCSKPNQQQEKTVELSENPATTEHKPEEIHTYKKSAVIQQKSKLKSEIEKFFENIEKTIWENEYGGGDCWNTYKEYKTTVDGYYAIKDNLECGEYGFTKFRLITSADKEPHLLEKTSKEWLMADNIPYLLKEWIVDFIDTSKIYYRQYSTDKFELSGIPDSVSFNLAVKKDLNLHQTLKSINASRTAKSE
jgi:hypothetical protein